MILQDATAAAGDSVEVFDQGVFTPNDAFTSLASPNIPVHRPANFRLKVHGQ